MAGPETKVTLYMVSPREKLNLGQCFVLVKRNKVNLSNSAIFRKRKTLYTMTVKAVQIVSATKIPCPNMPHPLHSISPENRV
ncbi:LOW QUALITY PROTEIN: hypothetical protein PanWU01x14_261860 [Parasponia andersonii]|uniref:Uncharacterized protein n=1 Tax=Parasponia andersonii TaxID=3476 RepID=A0A2P5B8C3_PARAD|nr:LOW QUALITY PROTEIN: hypothetical protein PanWU01x14_261860 [Parasponia andersonii]